MLKENSPRKHGYFCSNNYRISALLSLLLPKAICDLKLFIVLLDEGMGD